MPVDEGGLCLVWLGRVLTPPANAAFDAAVDVAIHSASATAFALLDWMAE